MKHTIAVVLAQPGTVLPNRDEATAQRTPKKLIRDTSVPNTVISLIGLTDKLVMPSF